MVTEQMNSKRQTARGALEGVRVLQLANPLTNYAGKLFAELGAEVILVEGSVGGTEERSKPVNTGGARSEAELEFAYFNTSKRSITLNLDTPEGQQVFRRLAQSAQLVLEATSPGLMEKRGLDYASLAELNPSLVVTSITPFGQDGPYSHYQFEDITLLALGGLLSLAGYPDAAPTAAWGQQAYLAGNQFGAVAAMLAVLDAESQGTGQHVDVSVQECVVMALENAVQFYELEGVIRKRYGDEQREAGSGIFPCKDGLVFLLAGGVGATQFWSNFSQWMIEEKVTDAEALLGDQWTPGYRKTSAAKDLFKRIFLAYALQHTKAELYAEGQARRVPICPLNTPEDAFQSRQLQAREFFVEIADSTGTLMKMPGAPYRMSQTPWQLQSAAPAPGQDNAAIYAELGYRKSDLAELSQAGVI
jgi:benzylsuccinate CoA-transferase BbsE subunit